MIRYRFVQRGSGDRRRFAPILTLCLVLANLLTVMVPLAPCPAKAAALDDTNSIIICSENGFKRVALTELDGDTPEKGVPNGCADCCQFCPIQLNFALAAAPVLEFDPVEGSLARRILFPEFERVSSVATPGWIGPRGPPALS
ncbi:DUF2946 family protein [Breoghania sp.]|uniref:DUF2946 family protein n=1 Tax=Breoghania sp. TaxID=2065378 RepID=UPI0029CA902B|nr:DUF2946 family protein [Breoghania sp.]